MDAAKSQDDLAVAIWREQ